MARLFDVYLVRHAESCSNVLDDKYNEHDDWVGESSDKQILLSWRKYISDNRNAELAFYKTNSGISGLITHKNTFLDEIIDVAVDELSKFKSSDELLEYIKSDPQHNIPSAKAYYVKNFMPLYTWLFDPPLSLVGILQTFQLQKFLHSPPEKISKFDMFIASSVIRTVITAMITLCTFDNANDRVLYIIPYINEHQNWSGELIDSDNQNRGNSADEITYKITQFTDWFLENGIRIFNLFLKNTYMPPVRDGAVIHFPKIDYTQLRIAEEKDPGGFRKSNIDKFNEYLRSIGTAPSSVKKMQLFVFTHGKLIKEMSEYKGIPKNTSIIGLKSYNPFNPIMPNYEKFEEYYTPGSIRDILEKIPEINTCSMIDGSLMNRVNQKTLSFTGGKRKYKRKTTIKKKRKNKYTTYYRSYKNKRNKSTNNK